MGQVLDLSFYRLKINNENHERVCFFKTMTTQIQNLSIMDNSNTILFISALTEHFDPLYSVIHNSIAHSKELCSKIPPGEVGVSFP